MSSLMLEYCFLAARPVKFSMIERLNDLLCPHSDKDPALRCLSSFSANLPSWAEDVEDFWKMDDNWELGCKGREITIGFSDPLSTETHLSLLQHFSKLFLSNKYAYTCILRQRTSTRRSRFPYHNDFHRGVFQAGHILFCERLIDRQRSEPSREEYFKRPRKKSDGWSGGYYKDSKWSQSYNRSWILRARREWCHLMNNALHEAGYGQVHLGLNFYGAIYPTSSVSDPVSSPVLCES